MWEGGEQKKKGMKVKNQKTLESLRAVTARQCLVSLGGLNAMNLCLLVFHTLWLQQRHKIIFVCACRFLSPPTSHRKRQSIGSCYIVCMYLITDLSPLHQAELRVYRTVRLLRKHIAEGGMTGKHTSACQIHWVSLIDSK